MKNEIKKYIVVKKFVDDRGKTWKPNSEITNVEVSNTSALKAIEDGILKAMPN